MTTHSESTVVVRFTTPNEVMQLRCGQLTLLRNEQVITKTEHGLRPATVLLNAEVTSDAHPQGDVVRRVTTSDLRVIKQNAARSKEALLYAREQAQALHLQMKIVDADFAFNGRRVTMHFSSDDRVDFRMLVRMLAKRFHTRIELRQIGVRDAARYAGGIGICGRELCCAKWLRRFAPISIRMAKDQSLALNHDQLAGVCGRLRCCLRYEQDLYAKGSLKK